MDRINYLQAMGGLQGISNPLGSFLGGLQVRQEMEAKQQAVALQRRMAEQKLADQQRAAQREAEYQGMVEQFLRAPDARLAAEIQLRFPGYGDAIRKAWDTQSEGARESNLKGLGGIYAALESGRTDLATSALDERIKADKEADKPTTDLEGLRDLVGKDAAKAKGLAGFMIANVAGPERFAAMLEQIRLRDRPQIEQVAPGSAVIQIDQTTGEPREIYRSPYRPEIIKDAAGNVLEYTPGGGDPASGGSAGAALRTNPGAIKDGSFARSQPGYTGSSGGFATFETEEQGKAAQMRLLSQNYLKKGFNTPRKIVERYAPRGAENSDASVNNYAAYVAGKLGIGVDDPVPSNAVPKLAQAMREFETGNRSGASGGGARVIAQAPPAKATMNAKGIYEGVTSREQFSALPRGALFRAPDGSVRRKP